VTASNTTALPDGVNRWGKNTNTGGARKSSASESNASSAWNFSGQSTVNGHSTNTGFENSGWGSTDKNNSSTSNGTGWGTAGAASNNDATVAWGMTSSPRDNGGWGTGQKEGWGTGNKDDGGWGAGKSGGDKDDGGWGTVNAGGDEGWGTGNSEGHNNGSWGSTAKTSDKANSNYKDAGSSKGWDQPTTSAFGGWGKPEEKSSDAQRGKGEGMTGGDIQMRDPLPQRKQDEPKPKSAQQIPRSPPRHPAESPAQTPLSPKYVSSMSAVSVPDLKSSALEVAKPKGPPVKINGAEGRRALYQSIIKSV